MSEYIDVYIDTTTKVPEDVTEFDYELFERFISGGPWVAHSKYMELKADNDRLRSELESVGTAAYMYGRSDLKAENAKLRECLQDLAEHIREDDGFGLDYGWMLERIRELGVEK